MAKTTDETCAAECPLNALLRCLCGKDTACSAAMEHFTAARVEVLKGIRSMLDRHIEELEPKAKGRRSSRIKVTEKG